MADLVGRQIGNYRITRLLGRGGFASMYLAEHMFTKDQVAIEVLPTRPTGKDLENFLAKARLTSRLVHPHILRTLEFGVEGDIPFIVTAYAPGGSLRQRHPRGSIVSIDTVAFYVSQVATALQYIHDQGVIHRDVKPDNMLLGLNNEILLCDFGIAVTAESIPNQTVQDVVGTPAYMAPEQFQGIVSKKSDQYSLGVVVYEWLSGTLPFQGTFIEVAQQIMSVPPPTLRKKVPAIQPDVEQVVLKALDKDRGKRFASVKEFAIALLEAGGLGPKFSPLRSKPSWLAGMEDFPTMPVDDTEEVIQGISQVGDVLGTRTMDVRSSDTAATLESSASRIDTDIDVKPSIPGKDTSNQDTIKVLSLFAIARTTLEKDDRAFVRKVYSVEAGISQSKPEGFEGEPFKLPLRSSIRFLFLDILLHTSSNIELISHWQRRLRYDSHNPEPQLVAFKFKVVAPGSCSLAIDFYYERRWLRTIHFEFDAVEQSQLTAISSEE